MVGGVLTRASAVVQSKAFMVHGIVLRKFTSDVTGPYTKRGSYTRASPPYT